MRRETRRGLLASALPVVAATAGCLDSAGSGDGRDETTGTRPTGVGGTTTDGSKATATTDDAAPATRHDVDDRSVRLVWARTARAVVTLLAATHPSVSADRDRQYVAVALDVSGEDAQSAASAACELEVDDRVFEPVSETVRPFTEGVHLAFALPLDVDPDAVTLAWVGDDETVRFPLSDSVASSLAAPPAFEVRSFDVPASADGDEVAVSFTVANVGESDGEFLAELGTRALGPGRGSRPGRRRGDRDGDGDGRPGAGRRRPAGRPRLGVGLARTHHRRPDDDGVTRPRPPIAESVAGDGGCRGRRLRSRWPVTEAAASGNGSVVDDDGVRRPRGRGVLSRWRALRRS